VCSDLKGLEFWGWKTIEDYKADNDKDKDKKGGSSLITIGNTGQ